MPGQGVGYEIEVFNHGAALGATDAQVRETMDGIRHMCADLLVGDQEKHSWMGSPESGYDAYGEDGLDHTSIFVHPMQVGEAVRRINECGYATDEDPADEDEEEIQAPVNPYEDDEE